MTPLIGVLHTLAFVLFASGADKVLRPVAAGGALRSAGMVPGSPTQRDARGRTLARLLGVVEVASAAAVVLSTGSGPAAIGVAVWIGCVFAGFAWFAARLESIDPAAGCGCFGASSAPPGPAHRLANLSAVAVAFASAVATGLTGDGIGIGQLFGSGATVWLPYVASVSVAAWLFLLAPNLIGELATARRGHPSHQVQAFSVVRGWHG